MRRNALVWVAVLGVAALVSTAGIASGSTGKRVFYLKIHPRECRLGTLSRKTKKVLVVPCSNPAHNLEVYAVGHGGWGHSAPPPQKTADGARASGVSERVRAHHRARAPVDGGLAGVLARSGRGDRSVRRQGHL